MGVGSSFDGEYEDQPSEFNDLAVARAQEPIAPHQQALSSQAPPPSGYSGRHYDRDANGASGSQGGGPMQWTGLQGSLWSGPTTALTPVPFGDGQYVPRDEVLRWSLPHNSAPFPTTSTMRMLRGARSIDSTRARLGEQP